MPDRLGHRWLLAQLLDAQLPNSLQVVLHSRSTSNNFTGASLAFHLKDDVLLLVLTQEGINIRPLEIASFTNADTSVCEDQHIVREHDAVANDWTRFPLGTFDPFSKKSSQFCPVLLVEMRARSFDKGWALKLNALLHVSSSIAPVGKNLEVAHFRENCRV